MIYFFFPSMIVNPSGRLNMPLVVFIPADEAQLGRWDLGEPEGKAVLEGDGPHLPLSRPPEQVGGTEDPGAPLKWSPVSSPSSHCFQGGSRGGWAALGKAWAFQARGSASVNGGEYTLGWLPPAPGLLGAQTSRLVENTDILAQGLDQNLAAHA